VIYPSVTISIHGVNQGLGYGFWTIGIVTTEKGFGRFWWLVFSESKYAEIFCSASGIVKG
jgi:hypothetical protein